LEESQYAYIPTPSCQQLPWLRPPPPVCPNMEMVCITSRQFLAQACRRMSYNLFMCFSRKKKTNYAMREKKKLTGESVKEKPISKTTIKMQHVDVNTFQSRTSHNPSHNSYTHMHILYSNMPRRFKADVEIGHKNSTAKDNRSHVPNPYHYPSLFFLSFLIYQSQTHFSFTKNANLCHNRKNKEVGRAIVRNPNNKCPYRGFVKYLLNLL